MVLALPQTIRRLATVEPAGVAAGVWTNPTTYERINATEAAHAPITGAATVTTAGSTHAVHFDGFRGFRPVAQPMPDGQVLLVGGH